MSILSVTICLSEPFRGKAQTSRRTFLTVRARVPHNCHPGKEGCCPMFSPDHSWSGPRRTKYIPPPNVLEVLSSRFGVHGLPHEFGNPFRHKCEEKSRCLHPNLDDAHARRYEINQETGQDYCECCKVRTVCTVGRWTDCSRVDLASSRRSNR